MISITQWKTGHFWLALASLASALGLVACVGLALAGHVHLYSMGILALALLVLPQSGIATAEKYIPAGLLARLETKDVRDLIAGGIAALLEKAGIKIDSLANILAAEAQTKLAAVVPPAPSPTVAIQTLNVQETP